MEDQFTFSRIIDGLSVPLASTTPDGRVDLVNRQFLEALLHGEKRLLEMVASGCPLEGVLETMCGVVHTVVGNSVCSILLIDPNGTFRHGAGPTLPPGYDGAINGAPVVCEAGPCGTAASLKDQVIVPDLASDPRWVGLGWRTLVLDHGLRSVCSTPIVSRTGKVLGTFAIYQRQPGPPVALLRALIGRFTHVASIAIERAISESDLQERERESRMIVDTIPGLVATLTPAGEVEGVNAQVLAYCGRTLEELKQWGTSDTVHSDDLPRAIEVISNSMKSGDPYEIVERIRRFDGIYRWFQVRGLPLRASNGSIIRWYVLLTDIDDLKRVAEALHESEHESRLIVDRIPGIVGIHSPSGEIEILNQRMLEYFGRSLEEMRHWGEDDTVHPEDLPRVIQLFTHALASEEPLEYEARLRRFDGVYRWFQVRAFPARDSTGRVARWYTLVTDIDDLKRVEDALRRSERSLKLTVDTIPVLAWAARPDGSAEFFNQHYLDFTGLSAEQASGWGWTVAVHPEDVNQLAAAWQRIMASQAAGDTEARLRQCDGRYRWFLFRASPLRDETGAIVKWYGVNTDIEDRKRAEAELGALKDQLYEENLVLRDEVDRTSMFEEIVGTSPALRPVLTRVAKVAPTESTVLITGETGTGKELIARAIHRRSARASRAFVSVNCAAVPRELIASELFGHEKGAFTGATQRRLGRFELAHGGTIFLDEVGELPMETQVALLRVLQEREFERVGGSTSVHVDVRVIAATNRDIQAAIELGTFRSDLFYRLNVFPIAVPALRERAEDIPLLVEYFIDRYARKAGKAMRRVNKRTFDHLRSYPWPGNVRELQNVIERSVIVCDTDEFTVDESWLSTAPAKDTRALSSSLAGHERAIIEDALRASGGRVFGPSGAAARLGIARSTLESKIRGLGIDKNRFRSRRTQQ